MTGLSKLAPVSVVIPSFRCADTIARAVASIATQTVRPLEVILVEDCRGDGTREVLNQLRSEYPMEWIRVIPLSSNVGAEGGAERRLGCCTG